MFYLNVKGLLINENINFLYILSKYNEVNLILCILSCCNILFFIVIILLEEKLN